jgi:hypothetical protein
VTRRRALLASNPIKEIGRGNIVDSGRYYVIAVDAIGDGVSPFSFQQHGTAAHEVSEVFHPRHGES